MFLHIPGDHPIFVEDTCIECAKYLIYPFNPDPGTNPQGQKIWKMSIFIIFSDNLLPKVYNINKVDYDQEYIINQFFGWLGYVKNISRSIEYWRIQINNVVINHTGFITNDFARNLYPYREMLLR
jgi:hypothetical protein